MDSIIKVNDSFQIGISHEMVRQIPYFDGFDKATRDLELKCDLELKPMHLNNIINMLNKITLEPTVHIVSHRDVYIILQLIRILCLPDHVYDSFLGWTENKKWCKMTNPEYLFFIHQISPQLADFGKLFSSKPSAISLIEDAVKLPMSFENRVEMINFFTKFDIAKYQESNDKQVQSVVTKFNKAKSSHSENFLINPFEFKDESFFEHNPVNTDVWDCKGISVIHAPNPGERTLVTLDEARERFREITLGLFEKSPNQHRTKPFPFANIVIAGGSITKVLNAFMDKSTYMGSDIDMFVISKSYIENSAIVSDVLDWFKTVDTNTTKSTTYFGIRGSVVSIYIRDVPRTFQLISINHATAFDVVSRFDMSHIQWCYYNGQFCGTAEALIAMREKVTRLCNTKRIKVSRLVKALFQGFSIEKTQDIIDNVIDIGSLIGNNSIQLKKQIREFYGHFYPTKMDMLPDAEEQHNLYMVEKHSSASFVTTDAETVNQNIVIGGNFDSDYDSILYSTFNLNMVANVAIPRRIRSFLLKSVNGVIRLMSPIMKSVKVNLTDEEFTLVVAVEDEEFREFCTKLEQTITNLYRHIHLSKNIIDASGHITLTIPRYQLNRQVTSGISFMRSQRGEPLIIEEDLAVDDNVQLVFAIQLSCMPGEEKVELLIKKIVKVVDYSAKNNSKLIDSVDTMNDNVSDFNDEIEYDEI